MDTYGFNVDVTDTNGKGVYFARSCLVQDGVLNYQKLLNEIFHGRVTPWFQVVGHPTTLILPGHANIALPSQLFPPKLTSPVASLDELSDVRDVNGLKLNWTGAPSIIVDYHNSRTKFSSAVSDRSCLDFFFNLSPFSSSPCVADYGKKNQEKTTCQKFSGLRNACFRKDYNTHDTLYSINKSQSKFITNIKDAVDAVEYEQKLLNETSGGNNNVQMYNEVFSYIYPWDITGIEVGGEYFESDALKFFSDLDARRKDYLSIYKSFLTSSSLTGALMRELKNDTIANWKTLATNVSNNNCKYLLAKFIDECNCGTRSKLNYDVDTIAAVIGVIIELLEQPLNLYEYGRNKLNDSFNLEIISSDGNVTGFKRNTPFEIFYQSEFTVLKSNIYGGTKKRKISRYRRGNRLCSGRNKTMRRTSRSSVRSRYN
jgi:hypothetical protein